VPKSTHKVPCGIPGRKAWAARGSDPPPCSALGGKAGVPPGDVYLTIDLDGFDPAVVPAVGTPVPGGLGWAETLTFIRRLCESRPVIGADVVELAPRDGLHYADAAAARLVHKIIGYVAVARRADDVGFRV